MSVATSRSDGNIQGHKILWLSNNNPFSMLHLLIRSPFRKINDEIIRNRWFAMSSTTLDLGLSDKRCVGSGGFH
ncbi:hypothetical protein GCM10009724_27530 [Microbacterium lacticum]|nr:hypothetical protein GCM10009724_27530 [Microbacterium lacticum]